MIDWLKTIIFVENNIDYENKEIFYLLLDIINIEKLEEITWKKIVKIKKKIMIEYGKKVKKKS